MKFILTLLLSITCLFSLCSCAVIGNLLGSVMRIPGSLLNSVTEAETPAVPVEQALPEGLSPETESGDEVQDAIDAAAVVLVPLHPAAGE